MNQSTSVTELLKSLVVIQSELPTMPKSSQAYGYKYADLDTITQAIKPILARHNVAYMQTLTETANGLQAITTRVFNDKGEYIEDTTKLPEIQSGKNNAAQTLGMSITYMRRYALCAMLGITSDEDTDCNVQQPAPRQAYTQQPKTQSQGFTPKGGETTAEEKGIIKSLVDSVYPNGQAVFTQDEKIAYSQRRKDLTAKELIAQIQNDLNVRQNNVKNAQNAPTSPKPNANAPTPSNQTDIW